MNTPNNRRPSRRRKQQIRRLRYLGLIAVSAAIGVLGLVRLAGYAHDYMSSKRTMESIKNEYYAVQTTDEPEQMPEAPVFADETPVSVQLAVPADTSSGSDLSVYPQNASLTIGARFQKIRRQNKDIVGWLCMEDILDQPVVQRDNRYYLRRDYQGYHNDNGALFLDEYCSLEKRPSLYIIWGHNMKTSAMFGCLRQYENAHFYHANPFISFDTMYENGEYVIFAVCDMSVTYLSDAMKRQNDWGGASGLIRQIENASLFTCPLDVTETDQLLMLATCTGEENLRRIVMARRIREGETREQLSAIIGRSRKR